MATVKVIGHMEGQFGCGKSETSFAPQGAQRFAEELSVLFHVDTSIHKITDDELAT
jgi:hypothetical protein